MTDHLRLLKESCRPDWLHQLIGIATQAADNRRGTGAATGPSDSLASLAAPRASTRQRLGRNLPDWQGLAELLLTAKGRTAQSWKAKQGFPHPARKASMPSARHNAAGQGESRHCANSSPSTPGLARCGLVCGGCRPGTRRPTTGGALQPVPRAVACGAELQLVFQESGEVDFAEIQMRAQRALGSPDEPTDLALALDYRLQHLLVDEFQDTSSSQYGLLATLTAGLAARRRPHPVRGRRSDAVDLPVPRGRGRPVPGRTRTGIGQLDPDTADAVGQFSLDPQHRRLGQRRLSRRSFRSGQISPAVRSPIARHGVRPGRPTRRCRSTPSPAGTTRPRPSSSRTGAGALGETDSGQVAVLARARSHLHANRRRTEGSRARVSGGRRRPAGDRPVVQDLHPLTRALLHPADRLAWLVVLRAPWLGLILRTC